MKTYLDIVSHILEHGAPKEDRTGTGTIAVAGMMFEHDMQEGFPLLTTKRVRFRSIVHELLWFVSGDTNIRYLKDRVEEARCS